MKKKMLKQIYYELRLRKDFIPDKIYYNVINFLEKIKFLQHRSLFYLVDAVVEYNCVILRFVHENKIIYVYINEYDIYSDFFINNKFYSNKVQDISVYPIIDTIVSFFTQNIKYFNIKFKEIEIDA